jgi:hypothetical protein
MDRWPITNESMNKDKAIFWLNRRIKELESMTAPPSQEAMAQAKISYSERQVLMEKKAKEAENAHGELSSLKEVVAFINEKA